MPDYLLEWVDPVNGVADKVRVLRTDDPDPADPDTLHATVNIAVQQYTVASADALAGRRFAVQGYDSVNLVAGPISNVVEVPGEDPAGDVTIVQAQFTDSNGVNVPSLAGTLASPATAGNLLLSLISIDKNLTGGEESLTTPSGWTLIGSYVSGATSGAWAYKIAAGGETTDGGWDWSSAEARNAGVRMMEVSGLTSSPLSGSEQSFAAGSTNARSTGTIADVVADPAWVLAWWHIDSWVGTNEGRAYTNSFTELYYDQCDGSGGPGLCVAYKLQTGGGPAECTFSTTETGDEMGGFIGSFTTA